jgi:hypothetical protein
MRGLFHGSLGKPANVYALASFGFRRAERSSADFAVRAMEFDERNCVPLYESVIEPARGMERS